MNHMAGNSLASRLSIIKRIKRLSFMPLPIARYVDIVFDLVSEAIPNSEVKVMILDKFGTKFIWKNIDFSKYVPLYNRCFEMTFEEIGVLSPATVGSMNKTVFALEEIIHPNFNNSYIYNELYKPINIYSILLTVLKNEGECIGQFPLFRAKDMPPFTKEDAIFMESIAPYIAYGIYKSKPVNESFTEGLDSEKPFIKLQERGIGLLLVNIKGEIISLNDTAKNMFFQIGLLDGLGKESIQEKQLTKLMNYINTITGNIFLNSHAGNTAPARVYTSRSGINIMMKGYCMEGTCPGQSFVAVTCEEVMPDDFMRLKKRIRFNLSQKEFEICRLLKEGHKPSEIQEMLLITKNTLKTHMANISYKLDLDNVNELRTFARRI
ncbi:MAG: response regulator transcription factor [bacterium]